MKCLPQCKQDGFLAEEVLGQIRITANKQITSDAPRSSLSQISCAGCGEQQIEVFVRISLGAVA